MKTLIASRKEREGRKERQESCAQTRLRFDGQAVDNALDAVLQAEFAKVDQQPKLEATEPKLLRLPSTFASFATFA